MNTINYKTERVEALLTQPPGRLLARYALPASFNMLMVSLYNIVDRVFVGNGVGYLGLSAVTVCGMLTMLTTAITLLVGMGGSVLFSIRLGEGKRREAEEILSVSFAVQLALGALVTAAGCVFSLPLVRLAGATQMSEKLAAQYNFIVALSAIPQFIGGGMINFARAEGEPRFAMLAPLTGTALNCALDPLFIYVFRMGVAGAAAATALSHLTVALLVTGRYVFSPRAGFRLKLRPSQLCLRVLPEIIRLGFSSFIMQLVTCVMGILGCNLLHKYGDLAGVGGDVAISVNGISTTVGGILAMLGVGMQQALSTLIGVNHGAGRHDRVRRLMVLGIASLFAALFVPYVFLMAFPAAIAGIFGDVQNPAFTVFSLRTYNLLLPLLTFQMLGCTYYQATGQARKANLLSLVRNLGFNIPLMLILPPLFGLRALIFCTPLADAGGNLISILCLLAEDRKKWPLAREAERLASAERETL